MKVHTAKQDNRNATMKIFTNYGEVIESEIPYRTCKMILDEYHKNMRNDAREMFIVLSDGDDIERRFIRMSAITEISIKTTKRQKP